MSEKKNTIKTAKTAIEEVFGISFGYEDASYDAETQRWIFELKVGNSSRPLYLSDAEDFLPYVTLAKHIGKSFIETLDKSIWFNYGEEYELGLNRRFYQYFRSDYGWFSLKDIETHFIKKHGEKATDFYKRSTNWKIIISKNFCEATTYIVDLNGFQKQQRVEFSFDSIKDLAILPDTSLLSDKKTETENLPETENDIKTSETPTVSSKENALIEKAEQGDADAQKKSEPLTYTFVNNVLALGADGNFDNIMLVGFTIPQNFEGYNNTDIVGENEKYWVALKGGNVSSFDIGLIDLIQELISVPEVSNLLGIFDEALSTNKESIVEALKSYGFIERIDDKLDQKYKMVRKAKGANYCFLIPRNYKIKKDLTNKQFSEMEQYDLFKYGDIHKKDVSTMDIPEDVLENNQGDEYFVISDIEDVFRTIDESIGKNSTDKSTGEKSTDESIGKNSTDKSTGEKSTDESIGEKSIKTKYKPVYKQNSFGYFIEFVFAFMNRLNNNVGDGETVDVEINYEWVNNLISAFRNIYSNYLRPMGIHYVEYLLKVILYWSKLITVYNENKEEGVPLLTSFINDVFKQDGNVVHKIRRFIRFDYAGREIKLGTKFKFDPDDLQVLGQTINGIEKNGAYIKFQGDPTLLRLLRDNQSSVKEAVKFLILAH